MYAIVDIAGQQFKVEKDQKVYVHRLEGDEGSKVSFDQVLLVDNDGKVQVGAPLVKGTVVTASIVSHLKADKVMVFKKKRRKGYQVLNGHRQFLTEVLIEGIGAGLAKAPKAKVAEAKKPAAKPAAKKTEAAKPKAATTAKKPVAKKPAAKKPVAAKPKAAVAAKKPAAKATPKAKKPVEKKADK